VTVKLDDESKDPVAVIEGAELAVGEVVLSRDSVLDNDMPTGSDTELELVAEEEVIEGVVVGTELLSALGHSAFTPVPWKNLPINVDGSASVP